LADLVQTRVNVAVASVGSLEVVKVGEAVLQGQPGYLDSTGVWRVASRTSQALAKASCLFITPAGSNGFSAILQGDGRLVNLGAALVVGKTYCVSTSGAIVESSELVTGNWITQLGQAISTSLLRTKFNITDIQVP
jgi:hypothetical protein